jgi:hypothetical protein
MTHEPIRSGLDLGQFFHVGDARWALYHMEAEQEQRHDEERKRIERIDRGIERWMAGAFLGLLLMPFAVLHTAPGWLLGLVLALILGSTAGGAVWLRCYRITCDRINEASLVRQTWYDA